MDLILWRHAQAEEPSPGQDDLARPLTSKGQTQAKVMAKWLKQHLPPETKILVSPAQRTRQTADALRLPYEICPAIAPDASPQDLLKACGGLHTRQTVLLVGHQPTLGLLASLLLAGREQPWPIKKGAIWWLKDDGQQVSLHAVLAAQML